MVPEKEFASLNVIPLVDVMLVLLTIVLTTSSLVATGMIPLELPRATKSRQEALKTHTITIARDGQLFLNSAPLSLGELARRLKPLEKQTPFLIRADKNIALQAFVDVVDLVKRQGFHRISLITQEK